MFGTRARGALASALVLSLGACSSSPADLINKPAPGSYVELAAHNKYLDHPSPAVSGPAGFGLGLGTIIGIPIMIAALPFTLGFGIAAFTDDPKTSNLQILGNAVAWPDAICAVGGSYAFGAIPELIVGEAPPKAPRSGPRMGARTPLEPMESAPPRSKDIGPPPGLDTDLPPGG
jgi:hypothetical protein